MEGSSRQYNWNNAGNWTDLAGNPVAFAPTTGGDTDVYFNGVTASVTMDASPTFAT